MVGDERAVEGDDRVPTPGETPGAVLVSPTYDADAVTIGKGPGLARFAIGISASAQPELYGPITAITDVVAA